MRVVIGYESMYGNTRKVADAIATAFAANDAVSVVPVSALAADAADADLLIVGVPTHAHGLPRPSSRRAAVDSASKNRTLHLDDSATDTGVREWLEELPSPVSACVATYDTRFRLAAWLVGHPACAVARQLARRGGKVVTRPTSFFVDKSQRLRPGELERAPGWGAQVRDAAAARNSSRDNTDRKKVRT